MKVCPVCGANVKGRIDKVYCSAQCKSSAQYEDRQQKEQFYIQVDKQLKLNRKILKKHNSSGYTTIRKEILLNLGFNPKFFTHYWKNKSGQVYLFCYDYGFADVSKEGKDKYILVEWQDYMRK